MKLQLRKRRNTTVYNMQSSFLKLRYQNRSIHHPAILNFLSVTATIPICKKTSTLPSPYQYQTSPLD